MAARRAATVALAVTAALAACGDDAVETRGDVTAAIGAALEAHDVACGGSYVRSAAEFVWYLCAERCCSGPAPVMDLEACLDDIAAQRCGTPEVPSSCSGLW